MSPSLKNIVCWTGSQCAVLSREVICSYLDGLVMALAKELWTLWRFSMFYSATLTRSKLNNQGDLRPLRYQRRHAWRYSFTAIHVAAYVKNVHISPLTNTIYIVGERPNRFKNNVHVTSSTSQLNKWFIQYQRFKPFNFLECASP